MIIDIETKFSIGDGVFVRQDLMGWDGKSDTYGRPQPAKLMVLGIEVETCYGGTQVHYKTRAYNASGSILVKYSEIELHDKLEAL